MTFARLVWNLLRDTVNEFIKDNAMRLAAALAYYTALSLAPLLLVVISLAGFVLGEDAARSGVVSELKHLIGPESAATVDNMLANSQPKEGGWIAGLIGIVTLIVGAVGVFSQLQDSLNVVWSIPGKQPSSGFWRAVKDRLLSFTMVCTMAFLLLVSLVLSAFLNGVSGHLQQLWPGAAGTLGLANFALSMLVTFAMFAMIFKVLPHVRIAWSDVWIGAAITTGLFAIGKYLIGLYLGIAAPGSTFGAAGSFVALLVWLYYSSLILLFGAEFTQVWATQRGTAIHGAQVEGAPAGVRTNPSTEVQPHGVHVPGAVPY